MGKMVKREIEKLEAELLRHKKLYYSGRPEISDTDYDALEENLRKLDPENTVLNLVGMVELSQEKIQHQQKMLSLNKTYKLEELERWRENRPVVSTYKIDGVSCSLVYEAGKLVLAKTRGDGSYGELILEKVRWVPSIPKKLSQKISGEVRGELFCTEADFIHLSQEMERQGLDKPTSQRNIVAGLMGRKDHLSLCEFIQFKAFELITKQEFQTEWEKLQTIEKLGFEMPEVFLHENLKTLEEFLQQTKNFMDAGDYQIDGAVFSFNELKWHDQLGETSHHPRYKMAFKFAGESKQTTIQEILWSVSRNGYLTPVALVEPVELSGASISRVTLHNYGMVKQFELKPGDTIEIIRSGEVIPKFQELITSSSGEFSVPAMCPSCSEKVFIEDIRLVCRNPKCPDQIKESILNFIKKIGIDDISSKRLEEMIKENLVSKISDLYDLTEEDFLKLDKVKDKLAQKFYTSIQASKKVNLKVFLSALGISGGAYSKCEKVVDAGFNTIEKLKSLTVEELAQVESFAQKASQEFLRSLNDKFPLIDSLVAKGFKLELSASDQHKPLQGKKICITGSLSRKRSEVEREIREAGGTLVGAVSKTTDYLLTNDTSSGSSKLQKAQKLGVPIINEEELQDRINYSK